MTDELLRSGADPEARSPVRVRLDLAYDGEPFRGFASQPGRKTVQGTLEEALGRLLQRDVTLTCAGRTDKGVHAVAQVVHIDLDEDVDREARFLEDLDDTRRRVDAMVGPPITIWEVSLPGADFDARFSATERGYRYRLSDAALVDPTRRKHRWHVDAPLDVEAMNAGAQPLLGEHDFASFCRKAAGKHTVRRLDVVTVERPGPGSVDVVLRGPAFCHHQARSIVGCLVAVGKGHHRPRWIAEVLESQDRTLAAAVAPAHGLTLEHVAYGDRWSPAPPEVAAPALNQGSG